MREIEIGSGHDSVNRIREESGLCVIMRMWEYRMSSYSSGSSSSVMSAGRFVGITPRPRARLSVDCSITKPEDEDDVDVEDFCLVSVVFELEPLRVEPRENAMGIEENEPELFCKGESCIVAPLGLPELVDDCPRPPANCPPSSSSLVQSSSP